MCNSLNLSNEEITAGLYFHIPFCVKKCIYCDFYSITKLNKIDTFVDYLLKELDIFHKQIGRKISIDTIFFGGGTPSLLNPNNFEKIFNKIHSIFELQNNTEITIEANPGTIDKKYLSDYRNFGINRISFGVQSFNEHELKFLNRIHSSDEAIRTIEYARYLGYPNISIDLIFGIPGQSVSSWKANLEQVKELYINHISIYNLIFEEQTPLYNNLIKGKVKKLDEEIEEIMYIESVDFLESLGYLQYELSNFAKVGYECRHNIKYWTHRPYFGFGPSAHSYHNRLRYWNYGNLELYYKSIDDNKQPIEDSEVIDNYKFIVEKIMLGLRYKGLESTFITDIITNDINQFIEQNILPIKNCFREISDRIILSKYGFFKLNEIALKFINQIDLKKI